MRSECRYFPESNALTRHLSACQATRKVKLSDTRNLRAFRRIEPQKNVLSSVQRTFGTSLKMKCSRTC
ncbi:Serine/threonine-protein kinase ULK1 [Fusarium oxysporum f. sp. albedinis]|nr:Serine/threonine-protein kinase ULK1 [Fusarium oxysporum f. sp. albedinis]